MENSNKKIVIKKILSKEFKTDSQQTFDEETLDNKIDDKFYEPINEENIDDVLKELESTPILYDTIKTRLSEEEIQRAGITLAKRIFELAQPRRETRDSIYINAFNVVLESYRVSDQYRILQVAHQFFLNEYREYMETRGERPGILSQIIRRVGKDNQEKYRHITNGVNLNKITENIFDILNDNEKLKRERIKNLLFGDSKNEISAIRSKINIHFIDLVCQKLSEYVTSYKQLNKKNEEILFEIFADKEEYKKYYYTYTSPEEAIYYLLSGREKSEISLIEERYNKLKQKDDAFIKDLNIIFGNDTNTLETLLNGINYEKIAQRIKALLYPEDDLLLGEELNSPGIYQKIKFPVKFNEINTLKDIKTHKLREYHQREKILQEFSYIKGKKALKLNEYLNNHYKFSLNESVFPELFYFNPEKIAFDVSNALFLRLEVADIIKILRYYDANELNQIKNAYLTNFNSNLDKDIFDYAIKALKGKFNDQTKGIYEDIISGIVRLDSSFDLIKYLLRSDNEFPSWDSEHEISQELTDAAYEIANIINNETYSYEEIENELLNYLKKFSYNELIDIKQRFYDLLEPKESLTKILIDIFGNENATKLDYIVNNINNGDELAGVLLPHTLLYLQNNITGNSLIKLREKLITDCENQDDIEIIINKCDLYASFLVRNFYTHLLRHDNIDSFLVDAFDLDYKFIKAIELIFNIKYSSLRRLLKEMCNNGILSSDILTTIILKLENMPIDITETIKFYINQSKLRDLLKLFSTYQNNQNTLEDIFEIIHLDNEVTSPKLKQLIKDSNSKLTDINECILYLDGYYPKELAKKIRRILAQNNLEEQDENKRLVQIKKDLTSLFKGISDSKLIPNDINWKIEQNYIATLYYKAIFKENIITTLKKLNISNQDLIDISNLIYGEEIVNQVLRLEEIVNDNVINEQEIETLRQILPLRHKRYMMILRDFFNSYTNYDKKLEEYIKENDEFRKLFITNE